MGKVAVLALLLAAGLLAVPAQAQRAQFDIGVRVTTDTPTNVVVRYRVTCDGVSERGRIEARTPLVRELAQTVPDATSCSVRAVAWDIKPHDAHPKVPPVVTTWVNL